MQLHRALVRRKPQGASGCWEPERGKKGRLSAGRFGKVQTMQEPGWPETTLELPGTAAGLPGALCGGGGLAYTLPSLHPSSLTWGLLSTPKLLSSDAGRPQRYCRFGARLQ